MLGFGSISAHVSSLDSLKLTVNVVRTCKFVLVARYPEFWRTPSESAEVGYVAPHVYILGTRLEFLVVPVLTFLSPECHNIALKRVMTQRRADHDYISIRINVKEW